MVGGGLLALSSLVTIQWCGSVGQTTHYREPGRKKQNAEDNRSEYDRGQILRPRNPVLHRKRRQHAGGKTARHGGTQEPELLLPQSHAPRREQHSRNTHRHEEQHTNGRQGNLLQVRREHQANQKKEERLDKECHLVLHDPYCFCCSERQSMGTRKQTWHDRRSVTD